MTIGRPYSSHPSKRRRIAKQAISAGLAAPGPARYHVSPFLRRDRHLTWPKAASSPVPFSVWYRLADMARANLFVRRGIAPVLSVDRNDSALTLEPGVSVARWPCAMLMLTTAVLGASGCRLVERDGSVSESLASCRQLTRQGITAIDRGAWEEADRLLAEAIQTCPIDPEVRRHYAEVLWFREDRDGALAQLDEALVLSGDDVSLLVRASEMRLDHGQVDRALLGVEQALDLDPKYPPALVLRGRIMQHTGQPRQALSDFHRALGYEPNQPEVLLLSAELYRGLGQPNRALVNLEALADTYPPGEEPGRVLYLTGLAYAELDRFDEASDSFAAALARWGPNPELLYQLARSQWLAGRAIEARSAAQQALTIAPRHAPTLALLNQMDQRGPNSHRR